MPQLLTLQLKPKISGDLYTDNLHRRIYSTDASSYQILPKAVLCPQNIKDVQEALKACAKRNIPLISRGGGSSVSGQSIGRGMIVDYSKYMNEVLEVNWEEQWVKVQAGISLDRLNTYLRQQGQMIGPDPASAVVATIGGMTANNSTGTHSIVYGLMIDQVLAVEVILANGELIQFEHKSEEEVNKLIETDSLEGAFYRELLEILQLYSSNIEENYPRTWRNVAGYNLNRLYENWKKDGSLNIASLIVGSEGTLGSICTVKLKTVKKPLQTRIAMVHFSKLMDACGAVPEILKTNPSAVEISNDYFHEIVEANDLFAPIMRKFIIGNPEAVLMVEYSADDTATLDKQAETLKHKLEELHHRDEVVMRIEPEEIAEVWFMRKAGFGLLMSQRGDAKPLTFADDATVPIDLLGDFMEEMMQIFDDANIRVAMLGHASAGCIHINPNINLKKEEGIEQMKQMAIAINETAIKYEGTTTGEHGEGLSKSYFNEKLYGKYLHRAFVEVKQLFDPLNIMQPGRIVNSQEVPWDSEMLRYYPNYETPHAPQKTVLDFSRDGGFNGMVEMCNGMGFCRKDGGVMCPSYKVTRDERHATRGRANALRAAIKGELPKGLSNKSLYEALDLCLECKACKSECPSMVDMAKLKYEYLSMYQEKHGVSLKNRLFANIHNLNKRSWPLRPFVNLSLRNPITRKFLHAVMGIDARRKLPKLARKSFQHWFINRYSSLDATIGEVILWDDTFTSYNHPEVGKAAIKVLETAGYKVHILKNRVCCGRPMISKGLLTDARENAAKNVALLLPLAKRGIPIIGLEPSCITSFKDEYIDLLQNEDAKIVAKQAYFFEDFLLEQLEKQNITLSPKALPQSKLLYHSHCYQKAIGNTENIRKLLSLIPNLDVAEIDSGCCGMAGSFGYEKKHYEVSMACGELSLFPTVRSEDNNTLIAAAGMSCRHQIKDGTGRKPLHPIEVLANAL